MRDHKDQSVFSDFTFATTPPSITVRSQSNGPHPSTSNNDEDDDWGDFIRSPVPSHTQSSPPTSLDPFSPAQPGSNPTPSLWEKPKGALPLSIFGEAEEENEGQGSAETHPLSGVGGSGVIGRSVSLPNKSSLIVEGTGSGLDGSSGTAKSDSDAKGFDDDDDEGWEFKAAGSVERLTDDKAAELDVAGNGSLSGLNSSWNAFSFDRIGMAKSDSQPKSGINGTGFDFYDGNKNSGNNNDWDFVGAESVCQVGDANSKVELDVGEKGSKSNSLTRLNLNQNAFSFDQIGLARIDSQPKSDTKGMDFDFYDENKKSGNDDEWGFVGAESVSQVGDAISRAEKKVENHGQAEFSFGIDNSAHSSKISDATSPSQWGFGLDVNPITLIQDGFTSNLYSQGKSNRSQNGPDSSLPGKESVTDEDLWGFNDVGKPNDTASGHDSSLARKDINTDEDFWDFKDAGKPDDATSGHDTFLSRKDDNTDDDSWDFKDAGKPDNTANNHDASISSKDDYTDEDLWDFKDAGKPDDAANGHDASLTSKNNDDDKYFWGFKDAGKPDASSNAPDSSLAKKDADTDEDVWEFKDAFSEMKSMHQEDRKSLVSPTIIQQLQDNSNNNAVHALNDTSVVSNGIPYQYGELNFGLHSSSVSQGGVLLHSSPERNQNGYKVVSKIFPADQIVNSDESLWTCESTSSESNIKHKEVPNVADVSAHSRSPTSDTDIKKEMKPEKKEALPLSLFSNQNLEADGTSSHEENILNSSSAFVKTSNRSPSSNISINDLISNLYNEADNQSPVKSRDMVSKLSAAASDLLNGDDDIDDDSWEFKDSFCENKANDQTSGPNIVESHRTISYRLELNECLEVFCKLKDELCFVVLCHLDKLEKTRNNGSLSSEDAEVATLDKEIEEFYNELHQDNLISKDLQSEEAGGNLQEVLGVLQEPKFQVLESELQLSKNILKAEKDLRSAIKLLRHVAFTLRILKMGSTEDQSSYVFTWFRVISICAEELKHAAFIWKQSLQTKVKSQILSNLQGKRYILAIGEVYRVVALIQASVKLYKPWIFCSVNLSNMHAVLSECSVLWLSSGLEEALRSISDIEDMEYEGTAESLLESINYIHKIDEFELQNYVFSEQERCCRLSLLKAGVAPGLKLETWNGENYFVKLVNFWGNIVSCDPPELPCLRVG